MSERPYFSLFGPAIRPQYYEEYYNNVSVNNNIPFEIVFVGNVPPTKTMPDNFRYIYSEATPAQCWDIAARATKGDFIIVAADDVRYSRNFLNRIYYYTTIFDMDKTLIAFRLSFQHGSYFTGITADEGGFFNFGKPFFPVIGLSGVFRKDLWVKIGGIDSRFYGGFADLDITFRYYYELGMRIFIIPDCLIIEVPIAIKKGSNLLYRSNPQSLLDYLWMEDGVFSRKRQSPVESFIYE
jgi:hypothetical protein